MKAYKRAYRFTFKDAESESVDDFLDAVHALAVLHGVTVESIPKYDEDTDDVCADCGQPLDDAESMVRNDGKLSHLDPCPSPKEVNRG